jgi:ribosomal protein L18E
MISKTKISKRTLRKRNPEIVETIELAKKNGLLDLGKKLSGSRSNYVNINLDSINHMEDGEILIVGKVLGSGEISKKKRVCALSFSEQAREKLKKAGCEFKTIKQEIEKNKDLKGVKIIG